MSLQLPLFIFLCFIASIFAQNSISSDRNDFINTVLAILENKQTLSDTPSTLSTFAYWQGSFWNTSALFDFPVTNGLVSEYYQNTRQTEDTLDMILRVYNGNYTDGDGLFFEFDYNFNLASVQIDQANATIRCSNQPLMVMDYPGFKTYKYCYKTELYIYVVEKATHLPPKAFDTSNLQAYTKQFRFTSTDCGFDVTTSLFDDGYSPSLFDKVLFVLGCLVYIFASWYSRTNPKPNKRKVSAWTLRLLMFFSYYTLAYIGRWLIEVHMFSDLFFLFIPFVIAMVVDFIKHSRDLSKNDGTFCAFLLVSPVPVIYLVSIPSVGVYIGNLLTCLYMLPQVIMKYKERYERQNHLTRFELGNFTCLALWVLYLDLYPNNVFLTSPKPTLAFIWVTVVLIQLSVLVYLEYGVPRKELFKYTFTVSGSERLVEEQCAICLNAFEQVNPEDDKLYKTPCGHLFHSNCLKEWGDKKLECPCCRKKIPGLIYFSD